MGKKVAIISDLDLRPDEYKSIIKATGTQEEQKVVWRKRNIISEYTLEEIQLEIVKKTINTQ
ncbi:hypothetical protein [Clostridium sp.]